MDKEAVIFDPKVTLVSVVDGYRIFGGDVCNNPAEQLEPLDDENNPSEVTVFIGNTHRVNEDGEHCSAGGVWYGPDDARNSTVRVKKELASKEGGEAAAILFAIQNLPREVSPNFKIKSRRILRALTVDLEIYEDKGWTDVNDSTILRAIVAALRGRGSRCTFQEASEIDGQGMKEASDMADLGLDGGLPSLLGTDIPPSHDLKGMKLCTGTQKSFYKAIKAGKKKPERMKTTIMLDITRHAATDLSGRTPTDSQIWLSIRNQDITRTTRDFMWRCLHQAYKVGNYWRNIPTYEHFATCQHCQVDDTMEHILLECEAPGQQKLWDMAQELWEMKGYQWPEMSYGRIFACGLVDVRNASGKRDVGANWLFRILISETAHLIWKLRCTRVIDRGNDPSKYFTKTELQNKWLHCINSRLRSDALLTDTKKYGNRALKIRKVMDTWRGVVKDPKNLSDTSIRQSRV
ncbi:ribonuclease H-like protein [Mycena leptocephala]|nr:ribonuclease H-like protein [Mycena leptocephala]